MRPQILYMILAASLISVSAFAQEGLETDDLYFNAKDRVKLNEKLANAALEKFRRADQQTEGNDKINPTDSYSARNINPEYSAQGHTETTAEESNDSYFLPNYQPTGINQNLASNNFNNPYFNNWNNWQYSPFGGYGYNGFNSFYPYSWMDPYWGNPYNSFYSPGWSMSLGYAWGGWNSWYGNLGYGWNSWSPWSYYGNYYGGWGGYYGNYPTVVVINNGRENNRVTYSKRPQRSTTLNHEVDRSRQQLSYTRGDGSSSGRTRSTNTVYYDRSWRRGGNEHSTTRSFWDNTNSSTSRTSNNNWSNGTNRNWNNGNSNSGRQSSPSFSSPTRGSVGSSSGGGSRSGGSGSSGGTRGRNN